MKIGILTFHFAFNQGAVLQCYAMQRYLESQGHQAYVIDYCPAYHTVMHSAWRNPFTYSHVFWKKFRNRNLLSRVYLTGRSFLRCMVWNITGVDKNNEAAFHRFCGQYLHLTDQFKTFNQLKKNPPELDAYISGSDQVWNPDLLGQEFDKAYFLSFGKPETHRITYAVSMGKVHDKVVLAQLKELSEGLDAISLREYSKEDVESIGRDVHICIDPTFLLNADDYANVESKAEEETPYIFAYGFETNALLKDAIDTAVKKYNCRVINGSPKWLHLDGNVKVVSGYGPDQFLTFIKNAECVVTNSFHGTAFSIIYKKDFITVPHSTRSKRMEDLLGKLGISFRLYGKEEFSITKAIDYESVSLTLAKLRSHSEEYLRLALSGRKGEEIPHHIDDEMNCSKKKISPEITAYYGYFNDNVILRESASGGAATALAEKIINQNGAVFGVRYTEDYKTAEFCCVEKLEDLDCLKGSKYIPVKTSFGGKLVYDVVVEKLLEGKTVLFIGSGCHVAALLNVLNRKNVDIERLYTVDLICHGPTLQNVYEQFIKDLEKKYKSKLTFLNMRAKKNSWVPPYIIARFDNGREFSKPLYETDFGFALRVCVRDSCYKCKFKGDGHVADITVGDYWGLKPGMKEYNRNGVSVMLSRSDKGNALIESIDQNRFFVNKTDARRVIEHNRMYSVSINKKDYIDNFKSVMADKGLHYAVIHSKGYPAYVKLAVRNRVKKLLGMR